MPWEENFSRGLYLAGAEVSDGAAAVNDFISPAENGRLYLYFPVKRL